MTNARLLDPSAGENKSRRMTDHNREKRKSGLLDRLFKRSSTSLGSVSHDAAHAAAHNAVHNTVHIAGAVAAASVGLSAASAGVSGSNNSAALSRNMRAASIELDRHLREMDSAGQSGLPLPA